MTVRQPRSFSAGLTRESGWSVLNWLWQWTGPDGYPEETRDLATPGGADLREQVAFAFARRYAREDDRAIANTVFNSSTLPARIERLLTGTSNELAPSRTSCSWSTRSGWTPPSPIGPARAESSGEPGEWGGKPHTFPRNGEHT